jgi:hypothetical protein
MLTVLSYAGASPPSKPGGKGNWKRNKQQDKKPKDNA